MTLSRAASLAAGVAAGLFFSAALSSAAAVADASCRGNGMANSRCAGWVGAASDHVLLSTRLTRLPSKAATTTPGSDGPKIAVTTSLLQGGSAAARFGTRAEGISAMEAFIMGQVKKAQQSDAYSVPADISESLAAFKGYAEGLKDDVRRLHAFDQDDISDSLDLVRGCAGELSEASGSSVDGRRAEHEACRVKQATMVDSASDRCEAYALAKKSAPAPPACSPAQAAGDSTEVLDASDDFLEAAYKWSASLWGPFEACRSARQQLENQTRHCDDLQEHFESSICLFAAKQDAACSCYGPAVGHYEARRQNISEGEALRQHIHTSAVRMGCYIDALVSNGTDKNATLHVCKDMPVNTSHLVISYGSVPDAPGDCSMSPPCSEAWLSEEYQVKDWHDKAPAAACSQCEATPATTPAPVASVSVYSTGLAFMVLNRKLGQAQCSGNPANGGDCSGLDFAGITDAYSVFTAFMALDKNTGKALCWGTSDRGGECSGLDFAGVTDVYSTTESFMALNKNTGQAQCWGQSGLGSDCSGLDFAGVTDVYSTGSAFMALNKNTGQAQCWGKSDRGGDCSGLDFAGVTDVYSTGSAFMALNRNAGQALCWGLPIHGGDCSGQDFSGVTDVYSAPTAFMVLNKNAGKAQCWGDQRYGGDCSGLDFAGVTDVYSTALAFMALNKNTGQAQCWGSSNDGGDCSSLAFTGVTNVYSTGNAFMAINMNTGQALCWGSSDHGGDCSGQDFTGVTDVYTSEAAFLALNRNTGQAQCWGSANYGGDCSSLNLVDWFA